MAKKKKEPDSLEKLNDQLILAKSKGDTKTARLIQRVIDCILTRDKDK